MNKTNIEWCDYTWNPLTGCLNNCSYCYAEALSKRFCGDVRVNIAEGIYTVENGLYVLEKPFIGRNNRSINYPFGFSPTFHEYRLDWPGSVKNGANIFVGSMTDIFGEWVPDEIIKKIFEACKKYPQHNYMFLTKNPNRYSRLAKANVLPKDSNFWWGSTITSKNSQYYPGRITDNTFLSIEPLLEPLNVGVGSFGSVKLIVIGAETGNRKSKVIPQKEWIEDICEAAAITKAPVFMKDSLVPIVGEENMRREFPAELQKKRISPKMHKKLYDKCFYCGKEMPMNSMTALLYREKRGESAKRLCYCCKNCFERCFGNSEGGKNDEHN